MLHAVFLLSTISLKLSVVKAMLCKTKVSLFLSINSGRKYKGYFAEYSVDCLEDASGYPKECSWDILTVASTSHENYISIS